MSEQSQKWHHRRGVHALACPIRSRWRRRRYHQPFWGDDKVAKMLGIAHVGCHRCGRSPARPDAQHEQGAL